MQLNRYQEQVIREVKLFMEALATQQTSGNRHPSLDVWDEARQNFVTIQHICVFGKPSLVLAEA